mmetsp:Transcript_11544/g.35682  ORF Transcript_11544/g.35682 Transcript_11544/m.35682 type:complete len:178 (+) Transcript_11544:208-741(+)
MAAARADHTRREKVLHLRMDTLFPPCLARTQSVHIQHLCREVCLPAGWGNLGTLMLPPSNAMDKQVEHIYVFVCLSLPPLCAHLARAIRVQRPIEGGGKDTCFHHTPQIATWPVKSHRGASTLEQTTNRSLIIVRAMRLFTIAFSHTPRWVRHSHRHLLVDIPHGNALLHSWPAQHV